MHTIVVVLAVGTIVLFGDAVRPGGLLEWALMLGLGAFFVYTGYSDLEFDRIFGSQPIDLAALAMAIIVALGLAVRRDVAVTDLLDPGFAAWMAVMAILHVAGYLGAFMHARLAGARDADVERGS